MQLTLSDLVSALEQFPTYHAIDVFADDIAELRNHALPANLRPIDNRTFALTHTGIPFKLEVFADRGVVRMSRDGTTPLSAGAFGSAMMGGLVGAAVDTAGKQKGAGLLGGLLLGLLVGAALGGAAGDARRVFALTYDRGARQWRAYDGGLLRWMKDQLAVPQAPTAS